MTAPISALSTSNAAPTSRPPESRGEKSDKGTISISFVREGLVCLKSRGLDAKPLLEEAEISPELLDSPSARVSAENYGRFWLRLAEVINDEFFGLDSHPMKPGSFTLLCHAVIHADTLETALRRSIRFLNLVLDDLHARLEIDGEEACVVLDDPHGPRRPFAYATLFVILHGLSCWLIGRRLPLHGADFSFAEPDFSGDWRVLFSPELRFNQPLTAIRFAADFLAMPLVQNERTMKDFLRGAPANFLVKYRNSDSLTARIRRLLREVAPSDWPDFDSLARQLHLSASTLRRRLDEEGQSYQSIKDELRCDFAIHYLSHTRMTVMELANTLGFAETSAFHRAFKKWTGASPGAYRHERRQEPGLL